MNTQKTEIKAAGPAPNRDSRGRFLQPSRRDAEQIAWDRQAEEESKLAKVYVEICKQIGQPELVGFLDIRQYPETGHWRVGHKTGTFFFGFLAGISFSVGKGKKKSEIASMLAFLDEARGIEKNLLRIEHRCTALVKQRN
jgi:hypothetical protein